MAAGTDRLYLIALERLSVLVASAPGFIRSLPCASFGAPAFAYPLTFVLSPFSSGERTLWVLGSLDRSRFRRGLFRIGRAALNWYVRGPFDRPLNLLAVYQSALGRLAGVAPTACLTPSQSSSLSHRDHWNTSLSGIPVLAGSHFRPGRGTVVSAATPIRLRHSIHGSVRTSSVSLRGRRASCVASGAQRNSAPGIDSTVAAASPRWPRSSSTSTRRPRHAVGAIAGRPHSRSLPTSRQRGSGRPSMRLAPSAWPPLFSIPPPRSETAALEAARAADLVIVPCRPQIVDLETVPTTTQVLALARDPLAVAVLGLGEQWNRKYGRTRRAGFAATKRAVAYRRTRGAGRGQAWRVRRQNVALEHERRMRTAEGGLYPWLRQFEPGSNSADANRLLEPPRAPAAPRPPAHSGSELYRRQDFAARGTRSCPAASGSGCAPPRTRLTKCATACGSCPRSRNALGHRRERCRHALGEQLPGLPRPQPLQPVARRRVCQILQLELVRPADAVRPVGADPEPHHVGHDQRAGRGAWVQVKA